MANKVILITGASSGIGLACADHLAARGFSVVGASRRVVDDVRWSQVRMDVDDDRSVTEGVEQVTSEHGRIDGVVTCAGWGLAGAIEQTPLDDARAQFETNFYGTVRVVVAALPMLRASRGRVVVMSSIGGVIALPFQAYYSASKFALEGWAEALAWEVKPFGVGVTIVQPGNFRSGFTGARRTVEVDADDPYGPAQRHAIEVMERDERKGAPPDAVARSVEKALTSARPPRRMTVGPTIERLGPLAKRLLPARAFEAASASSLGV
jgi:NAD(P)-dependent dehydrogenase (short-subunit alcohol dehydrogenase family)